MKVLAIELECYRAWRETMAAARPNAEALTSPEAATRLVPARKSVGSVAVISLGGYISQKPTLFSMLFGGTSAEGFAREVGAAMRDSSVGAVVLDVDSPGGEVFGTPEAAAAIRAARGPKPLVAVVNPMAGSAAYWLASQADEIAITPSGLAGSIGAFVIHVDDSEAMKQAGMKLEVIRHGRRKAEGLEGPLPDEARADLQARDDHAGALFEADVAKGRRVSVEKVRSEYGEGAMFTADRAVAAGLADRVATLEEVVRSLANGYRPEGSRAEADPAELRLRAVLAGVEQP